MFPVILTHHLQNMLAMDMADIQKSLYPRYPKVPEATIQARQPRPRDGEQDSEGEEGTKDNQP
jgi:hypothetical protein